MTQKMTMKRIFTFRLSKIRIVEKSVLRRSLRSADQKKALKTSKYEGENKKDEK